MSSVCANSLIRLLAASRPDTFTGNTILIRLWRRFPMLVSMRVAMGPREDRLSLSGTPEAILLEGWFLHQRTRNQSVTESCTDTITPGCKLLSQYLFMLCHSSKG